MDMQAMVFDGNGPHLRQARLAMPAMGPDDVLLKVGACGVCRTDLHIIDSDLAPHRLPLVPGHEVVGRVVAVGARVDRYVVGQRLGVPWLGGSCGHCACCLGGRENLCDADTFTGYDRDGGFAEYVAADARFCFALPERYDDAHAAPLLCAGLIGYRAYAMTGNARRLGLYGYGAAAHILTVLARWQGREVYAFTRPGDVRSQQFALSRGAVWAGASDSAPPVPLDAAIIFAPDGALVVQALAATAKGGTVVCAGIHMSDIPAFPYSLLWGERSLRSVANLTRADGDAFFALAAQVDLDTAPVAYRLDQANEAIADLRAGRIDGAAVLLPAVQ